MAPYTFILRSFPFVIKSLQYFPEGRRVCCLVAVSIIYAVSHIAKSVSGGVFLHLKQPPTRPHVITNISKSIHFHHKIKPIRASHVSQLSTGRELQQLFSSLHPFVSEKRHTQKNSNQTSPVDAVPLNVVFLNCQTCVYNTHTHAHQRVYCASVPPVVAETLIRQ